MKYLSDINHNLVSGCPLCDIFLNPYKYIKTKLYYPDDISKVSSSDFIIIDCKTCKIPMIVIRDHVDSVSKNLWNKILYVTKKQFGYSTHLRCKPRQIKDHFHCHINIKKRY